MKILISAYAFPPSLGGIEEVTEIVARELVALGHAVKIVTMTPSAAPDTYPFAVVRSPSPKELIDCVRWCDAYLQMHVSLRLAWPLLLIRRPWVVAIHAPITGATGTARIGEWIKRVSLRFARVTVIAEAMKRGVPGNPVIVPNPYRSSVFRLSAEVSRPNDLIFVGRLVSVKGVAVLLDALGLLRRRGFEPRLVIVGQGPEEAALHAQCAALQLERQVTFAGVVRNEALAKLLNQSRIMVLPSFWEGFPVVTLEGLACGCVLVASDVDGLPEAVGPCGFTFPKGDSTALADRLADVLTDEGKRREMRTHAAAHLARHQPRAVAEAYLAVIEAARRGRD